MPDKFGNFVKLLVFHKHPTNVGGYLELQHGLSLGFLLKLDEYEFLKMATVCIVFHKL